MNSLESMKVVSLLTGASILLLYSGLCLPGLCQKTQTPYSLSCQKRIESAERLLEAGQEFIVRARYLRDKAKLQILEAKRLKGEAEMLRTITPATAPQKLSPQEYQQATQQYKSDLERFSEHAKLYGSHVEKFQQQVGACHASEAEYQNLVKQYQLHCEQFHLPNVPPPHICLNLNLSQGEAAGLAFAVRSDRMRVVEAERDLHREESRLAQSEREAPYVEKNLQNQANRQQREQELAEEFGRLKQEYDLVRIEQQHLAGNNKVSPTKVVRSSVSGQVK